MCWDRIFCISQSVCWGRDQGEFAPGLSPTGGREGLGGYLGGYADSCRLQGRPIVHAHAHIHTHTYTQHPQLTHTLKPNHIPPPLPAVPHHIPPRSHSLPIPPEGIAHTLLFFLTKIHLFVTNYKALRVLGGATPARAPQGLLPGSAQPLPQFPLPASTAFQREGPQSKPGSGVRRRWSPPKETSSGGHRGWSREGLGTEERLLGGGVQLAPRDRPPLASRGVAVP